MPDDPAITVFQPLGKEALTAIQLLLMDAIADGTPITVFCTWRLRPSRGFEESPPETGSYLSDAFDDEGPLLRISENSFSAFPNPDVEYSVVKLIRKSTMPTKNINTKRQRSPVNAPAENAPDTPYVKDEIISAIQGTQHLKNFGEYKIPKDSLYDPFFLGLYKTFTDWEADFNRFINLTIGSINQPLKRRILHLHVETVRPFCISSAAHNSPSSIELGICLMIPLVLLIGDLLRLQVVDWVLTSKTKKSFDFATLFRRGGSQSSGRFLQNGPQRGGGGQQQQ